MIQNTFVRKAFAASMNSFRDWPCKHNRVFYEKIKTNIFVFKKIVLCELATKDIVSKANFQIFEYFFPRRVIGRKFSRFKANTLDCNTYDIRQGLLAMAEEQLIVEVGQAHVKQAHTTQHLLREF